MADRPVTRDSFGGYRQRLVETLRDKGIRDLAVLRAVATVPRHLFVPESLRHRAYEDAALPIGGQQTISQPYVQARSLEALRLTGRERVLEVGAGSGYQTALLSELADMVVAVERISALADGPGRCWPRSGGGTSASSWAMARWGGDPWRRSMPSSSPPHPRRCRGPW
jgi:hypothetical protein